MRKRCVLNQDGVCGCLSCFEIIHANCALNIDQYDNGTVLTGTVYSDKKAFGYVRWMILDVSKCLIYGALNT